MQLVVVPVIFLPQQLRWTQEYADEQTRKVFSKKSEATLGIIKPDGYERMGEIFRCDAQLIALIVWVA